MTPSEHEALEKAKDRAQSAREAEGSKLKVLTYYWAAVHALKKIDKKKACADALTGKVDALRELAEVLDHSGETGKAAECRQKADALNRELGESRRFRMSIASPSLTGPMISQEEVETKVASMVSLEGSATWATNISSTPRSTPPLATQTIISIAVATSIHESTTFFTKDVNPVSVQCSLPGPDEQLQSTHQLVYSLQLLQDSVHEEDLSPEAVQWCHSTRNNLDEKDRLQTIAVQIVQTFRSNTTKDAAAVAEVVQLAPVLDSEYSRLLLTSFTDIICQSRHFHVHLVGGLVKVIQGAAPGSISSNDLVVVLQSLFKKLQSTHPESTRDRHHLLLAVSQVLDTMADADIGSLDRDALHGPLKDLLRELESSDDPYLTFQAEYAAQALLNIPDDETVLKAGFRRVWSGLKVVAGFANILDPTAIKDSLEALENLYESGKGGARLLKDLRSAIRNNDHPTFSMKEGLKFKKAWYDALRRAEMCINAGWLVEFKNLVTTASYRHQFEFQWGICQLLGRFAIDTQWGLVARREAIVFLGDLYKDSELWNRQEGVDQVVFDVLTNVTTNDGANFEGATSLLEEIRKHSPELDLKVDLQSPLWNNCRPSVSTGYTDAKFTLMKSVQAQYPWKPRLYGIHRALNAYHAPELVIRRVSGDTLDLETCFVNLAIVEAPAHRQKEKQDLKEQATVFHRMQSFECVENTNTDAVIPLEQLFNKRKLPLRNNEREDVPRRILVQGRAGIGKTTLCKKLVHAHQNGLWRDLFDVVLWIPLRSLRGFTGNTLEGLFRDKIFIGQDRVQRQEALAEALVICAEKGKVLFILDGMDEIVADTESEERQTFRRLLMTLLGQQYVVVTSRPSGVDSSLLQSTDLELETVGFSRQNVQDFVVKVLDSRAATSVQNFIRRTPLIQGLVNIPVQLDVICFSWDTLPKNDSQITMTGLYQLMVRRLCCKDAIRLKKKTGEILLNKEYLDDFEPHEIDNLMATELMYLGYLAFKGMNSNHQIEFQDKDIRRACGELDGYGTGDRPLAPLELVEILKKTSFLHTADADLSSKKANSERSWHFLHLTFQEYFAATWIVRHFHLKQKGLPAEMMSKNQLADYVHQHKYNPQYEIVWTMVAGLLEGEALVEFFGLLQGALRDLIGGRHQLILASCFNETRGRLDSKYANEIDEELQKWLRFEMHTLQHDDYCVSRLGSRLSFPEATLIETLRSQNSWRNTLARTLGARSIISDKAINFLVSELKDDKSRVRCSAATALGKQSPFPESVILPLVAALNEKDWTLRISAADALGNQSELPKSAILPLVAALNEKDWTLRISAADALGNQSELPELAVRSLVDTLKNGDKYVGSAAANVLRNQSELPESAIISLVDAVKYGDNGVGFLAAVALGNRSELPESAIGSFVDALRDGDKNARSAAAEALSNQSELPESAIISLVDALKDENEDVRFAAAKALGKKSALPELAVGSLVDALKDEDKSVSSTAKIALSKQFELPESAIRSLVRTVKDGDEYARFAAAMVLGNQPELPESAVESLVDALKDEDGDVRSQAADALGKQSELPESAVRSLVDTLKHVAVSIDYVRTSAAEALRNQSELPESAIGSLIDALKDRNRYVRSAAASVLSNQSELPESAVGFLAGLLKDGGYNVRYAAANALGNQSKLPESAIISLVDALKDGDKDVRSAAARALGSQSELPESAVKSLVDALKDEYYRVGHTAVVALGKQSVLPELAVHFLIALLKDRRGDASAYALEVLRQHSHSICIALPQLSKDEIMSVYERCLFQYSCRRALSLQVQDSTLRIYTETREMSETIGSDVQEKIFSAVRAVQDEQGLTGDVLQAVLPSSDKQSE
ncbi:hypothetical protein EMPS_09863 [Entomortierella parvispora]|uniref:NACHT domain-containing protein n=1 Tax=Entomortierella parvispora TaxID=205924 RepID=A0A9P3HIT7_9FUNG|nr:hypothetical protein EMPS_09863 [Entomortierella parvispora]